MRKITFAAIVLLILVCLVSCNTKTNIEAKQSYVSDKTIEEITTELGDKNSANGIVIPIGYPATEFLVRLSGNREIKFDASYRDILNLLKTMDGLKICGYDIAGNFPCICVGFSGEDSGIVLKIDPVYMLININNEYCPYFMAVDSAEKYEEDFSSCTKEEQDSLWKWLEDCADRVPTRTYDETPEWDRKPHTPEEFYKTYSAASGETTKSIGTDEITTVGVTSEEVTTAARIYIDINEVGSANIDSMKLTLTKGMTVKDVFVAMKSAGAENLSCMFFPSSKNGPLFVFRLDDGLSFQMAVSKASSDAYYPVVWSINNDWTWTNVSAEEEEHEHVWERFEHYAYGTSSEQPTQSTGTVEIVDGIPTVLPNGNAFDVKLCVDFEDSSAYTLSGKSFEAKSFRWNASGIRGKGIAIGLTDEKNDNRRAEVQVAPAQPIEIGGCSGILFWVDFSGTDVNNEKNGVCASVSMNGNDYRTNKNSNGSVGYYLLDGKWIETKNVNACRLELPHQYKGWVYVPASSYQDTRDVSEIVDQNGNFKELSVQNLRLYTDYYNMEKTAEIIFDEILFVKAK